jgi:hypothetical protein
VQWLGENPAEAHLPAIRLALTDASPTVRAAALIAASQQPGEVKGDEFTVLRSDPHPRVREAYLELASRKGLPK